MISQSGKPISDKKPAPSSDAARTGEDADKDREEPLKKAEKGVGDATGERSEKLRSNS